MKSSLLRPSTDGAASESARDGELHLPDLHSLPEEIERIVTTTAQRFFFQRRFLLPACLDRDDLIQEGYYVILERFGDCSDLPEDSRASIISRTVQFHLMDLLRQSTKFFTRDPAKEYNFSQFGSRDDETSGIAAGEIVDTARATTDSEHADFYRSLLANLEPEDQLFLYMTFVGGFSPDEVARKLQTTPSNLSYRFKARILPQLVRNLLTSPYFSDLTEREVKAVAMAQQLKDPGQAFKRVVESLNRLSFQAIKSRMTKLHS